MQVTGRTIVVIVNANAGSVESDSVTSSIEEAFMHEGCAVRIEPVEPRNIVQFTAELVAGGTSTVVAVGGDGTINAVATSLIGTECELGIVPLGTLNHLSKDLGIPQDVQQAVHTIVHGRTESIDTAEVNGQPFLNNSSIGAYPKMVKLRDEHISQRSYKKWFAMILASIKTFVRMPRYDVSIEYNGVVRNHRTPCVFVGNNKYELDFKGIGTRLSLKEGILSLFTVKSHARLRILQMVWYALVSNIKRAEVFDVRYTTSLTIDTSRRTIDVSLDGEVRRLAVPLVYQVHPHSLRVRVPKGIPE